MKINIGDISQHDLTVKSADGSLRWTDDNGNEYKLIPIIKIDEQIL